MFGLHLSYIIEDNISPRGRCPRHHNLLNFNRHARYDRLHFQGPFQAFIALLEHFVHPSEHTPSVRACRFLLFLWLSFCVGGLRYSNHPPQTLCSRARHKLRLLYNIVQFYHPGRERELRIRSSQTLVVSRVLEMARE